VGTTTTAVVLAEEALELVVGATTTTVLLEEADVALELGVGATTVSVLAEAEETTVLETTAVVGT